MSEGSGSHPMVWHFQMDPVGPFLCFDVPFPSKNMMYLTLREKGSVQQGSGKMVSENISPGTALLLRGEQDDGNVTS